MPKELDATFYEHQVQGISWLIHNEDSDDLPGWFEGLDRQRKTGYSCQITKACDLRLVPYRRRMIVAAMAEEMAEIDDLTSLEGIALLEKLIGDLNSARVEEEQDQLEESFVSESDDNADSGSLESQPDVADGLKCLSCEELLSEDMAIIIHTCQHTFCVDCLDPDAGTYCPECS